MLPSFYIIFVTVYVLCTVTNVSLRNKDIYYLLKKGFTFKREGCCGQNCMILECISTNIIHTICTKLT